MTIDFSAAATTRALAEFLEVSTHAMARHLREHREQRRGWVSRAYLAELTDPDPPSETTSRAPNALEMSHEAHVGNVAGCLLCALRYEDGA